MEEDIIYRNVVVLLSEDVKKGQILSWGEGKVTEEMEMEGEEGEEEGDEMEVEEN